MAPKFGTSGLRGLVTELTKDLVQEYVTAFLVACPHGGAVHVGQDLRPSSPQIADWVIQAVLAQGVDVVDCGILPTPALALSALASGQAALMVTGSHIPADRNGLKFYVPGGEILKEDEARILAHLGQSPRAGAQGQLRQADAMTAYAARYIRAYGPDALAGLRIGVYQHSSVARDVMLDVLQALGAECVTLARSDLFIPVDTEALDPETRHTLAGWSATHKLDAVVSTDGDADRPMVADALGQVVPGDVLGALTARSLGAKMICTPVSSNSMVLQMPVFDSVSLTQIGSPFVIAAMQEVLATDPLAQVVGYEANGGFLLGFDAKGPVGPLAPLMTRDCLLPIIGPLTAARALSVSLADLVADLPQRFTAADRIQGIATETSAAFIKHLSDDIGARQAFFDGIEGSTDLTDGLRLTFQGGDVVHLRPSGNAPELRCYAEAATTSRAQALVALYLGRLQAHLAPSD